MPPSLTPDDLRHLRRCLALATEALEAGGEVLAEARNRVNERNALAHPELTLAQWAVAHLSPAARAATTLYTSGEHCPMCAAAHGWLGLGKIVYLSSGEQLTQWLADLGAPNAPVRLLPITTIVPTAEVAGPATGELLLAIKTLQVAYHTQRLAANKQPPE